MSAPKLIGIRGAMGSGKDTLAAEIMKHRPEYHVRKFADKLREAAAIIAMDIPANEMSTDEQKQRLLTDEWLERWGVEAIIRRTISHVMPFYAPADVMPEWVARFIAVLYTPSEAAGVVQFRAGLTVGRLLQLLGTECFRDTISPAVWSDAVIDAWRASGCTPTVISDARFPNETDAIRRAGGVIIEVRRGSASRDDGRSTRHASERALDNEPADFMIENDGAIEDLGEKFEALLPALNALALARAAESS